MPHPSPGLLALALLAAVSAAACARPESYERPKTPVQLATAKAPTQQASRRFTASLEPIARVELAFKVGGYLQQLAQRPDMKGGQRVIEPGDRVKRGETLATLRTADYAQRVAEARAGSAVATAQLADAESTLARLKTLNGRGVATDAEREAAQHRFDAAKASVDAAGATVGSASLLLADTRLTAPFDGVVLSRRIDEGALVAPGMAPFAVGKVDELEVRFAVPDTLLARFHVGDRLTLTSPALPGRTLAAAVYRLGAEADQRQRSFEIVARLPNGDGALKPGLVVEVEVELPATSADAKPVALVPLASVVRGTTAGAYDVFTIDGGRAKRHAVKVAGLNGAEVALLDGVKPGENVVGRGASLLADGMAVEVVP